MLIRKSLSKQIINKVKVISSSEYSFYNLIIRKISFGINTFFIKIGF